MLINPLTDLNNSDGFQFDVMFNFSFLILKMFLLRLVICVITVLTKHNYCVRLNIQLANADRSEICDMSLTTLLY